MFRKQYLIVLVGFFLVAAPSPSMARAETLDIEPVAQQAPLWCWAAAGQMVLEYYGFPNLNPAGNFQCAVVAAQGGPCLGNCGACLNGGGTTQRISAVLRGYAFLARQYLGFYDPDFQPTHKGPLSNSQIVDRIDSGDPVIAGISPSGVPYPAGSGFSQHAVVIIGYDDDGEDLEIVLNDPYPYPFGADPYSSAGGTMLEPGQYQIAIKDFRNRLHYGNSIVF